MGDLPLPDILRDFSAAFDKDDLLVPHQISWLLELLSYVRPPISDKVTDEWLDQFPNSAGFVKGSMTGSPNYERLKTLHIPVGTILPNGKVVKEGQTSAFEHIYDFALDPTRYDREEPYSGVVESIQKLQKAGVKVYILTAFSRKTPNKETQEKIREAKRRWVERHLPGVPIIFSNDGKDDGRFGKGEFARYFHILVDDLPKNVEEFEAAGGRGILLTRPWNVHVRHERVNDLAEVVPIILKARDEFYARSQNDRNLSVFTSPHVLVPRSYRQTSK